ncbi:MAG: hypothetical protein ACJAZX_000607 [Rickettsiales bacterium]|jgi:hypothetical protein
MEALSKDISQKRFLDNLSDERFQLKIEPKDLDLSISILSDSIIISFSKNFLFILPHILRITRLLQIILIFHDLLSRGAVVCEKIYHTKDDPTMLFGKGLVEAHIIKSNETDPIMRIDNKLWNQYQNLMGNKENLKSKLRNNCICEGDLDFAAEVLGSGVTAFRDEESENKVYFRHFDNLNWTLERLFKKFLKKKTKGSNIDELMSIVDRNIHNLGEIPILDEKLDKERQKKLHKWSVTKYLIENFSGLPLQKGSE